jgi:hypothetical protein
MKGALMNDAAVIGLLIVLFTCFLPWLIADCRKYRDRLAIAALNVLFVLMAVGVLHCWTIGGRASLVDAAFILTCGGWVLAMAWARDRNKGK